MSIISRLIKSSNQRTLSKHQNVISDINKLNDDFVAKTDEDLRSLSNDLRASIRSERAISPQHVVQSFALVREASRRILGMPHYDVQLVGGLMLHLGKIAEMRTGEGKTLVATLSAYLNSAIDQVHVVTVNDYLAKRDCEIVAPVFEYLGVKIAYLQDNFSRDERHAAYQAEVLYGTSSQFGFDYLRDNMVFSANEKLQKKHHYAIIDEADSILIDEARTPLIISGEGSQDPNRYIRIMSLTGKFDVLVRGDDKDDAKGNTIDDQADAILLEKTKSSRLTDRGFQKLEQMMTEFGIITSPSDLYTQQFLSIVTDFQTALKARHLYRRDTDYIVRNDKIEIIDENTGRIADGRRWSDGLHQFIEAKENVTIKSETVTLGSITLQNFFKLYDKISGMTGTADTEAAEMHSVYGLDVVVIPTNKAIQRKDSADILFISAKAKFSAITKDIQTRHAKGQPILVGTSSVENSEYISNALNALGIPHNVLNAKQHDKEALIIAQAGRSGAVTIATNMAGRGTDIILGGNHKMFAQNMAEEPDEATIEALKTSCEEDYQKVIAAGGLHVIGTERHDSRRVDNQLRGRAGRQGDPGSSIFYVSLEDKIMRISGGEKLIRICTSLGLSSDDAISHPLIQKSIQKSQITMENHGFEQRKELVKFDEVLTKQRMEIYGYRNEILMALPDLMVEISEGVVKSSLRDILLKMFPDETYPEQWDFLGAQHFCNTVLGLNIELPEGASEIDEQANIYFIELIERAYHTNLQGHLQFMHENGQDVVDMRRTLLLKSIDNAWRANMIDMESLQDGIHLRGYSNKDPKVEFARESIERFSDMISDISETYTISMLKTSQEVCRLIMEQHNKVA